MNDELLMLRQTLDEALATGHPATWEPEEGGALADATWAQARELGWDHVGLPEELGGFGDGAEALVVVAQACGRHRLPAPLVETALGRWAIAAAGLEQPAEGATIAIAPEGAAGAGASGGTSGGGPTSGVALAPEGAAAGGAALARDLSAGGLRVSGTLARVAWGRYADRLVVADGGELLLVDLAPGAVRVEHGENLAGEARDTLVLDGATAVAAGGEPGARAASLLILRAAMLRAAQIEGALGQALAITREHTEVRRQFGRPLARFQLVGAHVAEIAAQAALVGALLADATAAHDAAAPDASAHDAGDRAAAGCAPATDALAAAEAATASLKVVAAEAATAVARSAHQCHGAIGTTREYRLHQYTRRLWSWREEHGSEHRWRRTLGAAVLAGGPARMWAATEPAQVAA